MRKSEVRFMVAFIVIGILMIFGAIFEVLGGFINPLMLIPAIFSGLADIVIGALFIYAGVSFKKVKLHERRIEELERKVAALSGNNGGYANNGYSDNRPSASAVSSYGQNRQAQPTPQPAQPDPYAPTFFKNARTGLVYEVIEPFPIAYSTTVLVVGTRIILKGLEDGKVHVNIKFPTTQWIPMKVELNRIGNAKVKRVQESSI